MSENNKENKSKELTEKLHQMQMSSLRNKATRIENKKDKKKRVEKTINRKYIKCILFTLIIVIIIVIIICGFTDVSGLVKKQSFASNLKELEKELNVQINALENKNKSAIKELDSKISMDAEGKVEVEDCISEFKNEYTMTQIAVNDGKLIYIGLDKELQKIAEEKNIKTDYLVYSDMYMDESIFVVDKENGKIRDYLANSEIVYIPQVIDGVKIEKIGAGAFKNKNLKVAILPNSVTEIEAQAFANNNLNYVELPIVLNKIGNYAFYNNELENIEIGKNIQKVGEFAFALNNLTTITIEDSNTKIGAGCFNENFVAEENAYIYKVSYNNPKYELVSYAGNSENIVIEEGVEKIGVSAFSKMLLGQEKEYNTIKKVEFPSTLKIISANAFENNSLQELVIPEGVLFIGHKAFKNNSLKDIKFSNYENIYLGNECFNNNLMTGDYSYIVTNKSVPSDIEDVETYAGYLIPFFTEDNIEENAIKTHEELNTRFNSKRTLVSYAGKTRNKLLIPYSVEVISEEALCNLEIENIELSDTVIEIKNRAFANNKLKDFVFKSNVQQIESGVLDENPIESIKFIGKTAIPENIRENLNSVCENIIFE